MLILYLPGPTNDSRHMAMSFVRGIKFLRTLSMLLYDDELADFRKLVREGSSSASEADSQTTECVLAHLIDSRSLI